MNSPSSEQRQQDNASVVQKASNGYLQVTEGSVFWRLDLSEGADENEHPTILLIHAGVADHTMWDDQVKFLVQQGWNCLRYDLLGFGNSNPSDAYLQSAPREPFDSVEHINRLLESTIGPQHQIIVIGLSIGASLALNYTLEHPERVAGLVLVAGGLRGFEYNNDPREDALFDTVESLMEIGDVHGAANLNVRIWGDGPLKEPGRITEELADRMQRWNVNILARDYAKTGGDALPTVRRDPPAIARLHMIGVPTAVALGTLDESFTTAAMKYVANNVKDATLQEFETAHMINLEQPEEFNQWLNGWLETHFEE